jgi:DNA/RNA endonuclease G, NUC1
VRKSGKIRILAPNGKMMKKNTKSLLSAAGLVVIFALWLILQRTGVLSPSAPLVELPDQLELPAARPGDRIMTYQGYVSSYNPETLIPDWVAYELTAEETRGDATRADKEFSMDMNYHGKQAMREDYWGSGWTRGHMAPAADFMWDDSAMTETFYFMNICPQREELNNKDWQYLEKQVRAWARKYGKVWVVSGPIVGDNIYGTIGKDHVVVPDAFYKVVMVHDGRQYQSIAFVMGNDAERYWLSDCALTVDELENLTGLDFYPALPDDVEDDAESRYDLSVWGIRKR